MHHTIHRSQTLLVIATLLALANVTAKAADTQASCRFEHPDRMLDRLAKEPGSDWTEALDYPEYVRALRRYDKKNAMKFMKCEESFKNSSRFRALNKKLQSYLIENYKASISGVNIEGGDFRKGDFLMFSSCQPHACVTNVHTDIFDKDGNMVSVILYQYPSDAEGGAAGQAIADVLRGKHSILYFPLEAWIFIRKGYETPGLRSFIEDAVPYFRQNSETTILDVHDISD
ncbi:hypothetical protein [Bombella favorum]|uniref:Uncharacterized protein n=1 Tax=Bombella favorum TaxID=2039164 RepID=A0ABR5ZK39_9PROT|nr:hypothetical protein [Bombella favorum]MBA5724685.1 hypothetical protein [Bombella favorum]